MYTSRILIKTVSPSKSYLQLTTIIIIILFNGSVLNKGGGTKVEGLGPGSLLRTSLLLPVQVTVSTILIRGRR